jgi:hypothetical protein
VRTTVLGFGLRVFGQVLGKEFQGKEATDFAVLSFVNHTHATGAKSFKDAECETVCPTSGWESAIVTLS